MADARAMGDRARLPRRRRAVAPRAAEATIEALLAGHGRPRRGPARRDRRSSPAPGRPLPHLGRGELRLEDGGTSRVDGECPPDLPLGYHRFDAPSDGRRRRAVDAGDRQPGPVLAARRPPGLGLGGPALRRPVDGQLGHGRPGRPAPPRASGRPARGRAGPDQPAARAPCRSAASSPAPISPAAGASATRSTCASRRCPAPSALARLPELAAAGPGPERRPPHRPRRRVAAQVGGPRGDLRLLATPRATDADFDRYVEEQGAALRRVRHVLRPGRAARRALGKLAGRGAPARRCRVSRRSRPGEAGARRIRYHSWLQWLLDGQLQARRARPSAWSRTSPSAPTPAGPTPGAGRTAWRSACGSAPRPTSSTRAARTGRLPPFDPWRLRAAGYEPFIELVRAGLRHAGGLRFDHVMGLFRLFWIPAERDGERRAPTCATRGATCSTSWPWRASGPGRSSSARTWARSRTGSGRAGAPPGAVVPAAVVRARRRPDSGRMAEPGAGRGDHPRPADRGRPVDRRRPRAARGAGPADQRATPRRPCGPRCSGVDRRRGRSPFAARSSSGCTAYWARRRAPS